MTNTAAIESVDSDLPQALGSRIHQLLWERRVTQRAAAEHIGLTQPTLSRKLRGTVPLTVVELVALAQLLDTEPANLLPRLDSNQQPFD